MRLKHFERVVASILPIVRPIYTQLPPPPPQSTDASLQKQLVVSSDDGNDDNLDSEETFPGAWPFAGLPLAARVHGSGRGQLSNLQRATHKEQQVRSMLQCIVPFIPQQPSNANANAHDDDSSTTTPPVIVDFGGGSGHLAIPMALLFPNCIVVCVDLSARSLDLLHQKANECRFQLNKSTTHEAINTFSSISSSCSIVGVQDSGPDHLPTAIPNLFTFLGAAESWNGLHNNQSSRNGNNNAIKGRLDIAVALHLCGEGTDVVLRLAAAAGAVAMVVAPCCVGKLSRAVQNPYIFQATGSNTPTVSYPQSQTFCKILSQEKNGQQESEKNWNALAKAADYSDTKEFRTSRNAARRTAKALLETDRQLYLKETYGYQCILTRMNPWEATPKNDILVAWRPNQFDGSNPLVQAHLLDAESQADVQWTIDHLLLSETKTVTTLAELTATAEIAGFNKLTHDFGNDDSVDWTLKEKDKVSRVLLDFVASFENNEKENAAIMVFPTGMGGRQRKLVHYLAEQMGLAHWCQGSKHCEKTVAVACNRSKSSIIPAKDL